MKKVFLTSLLIYGLLAGSFALAQVPATVSATVPDFGQGNQKQNIAGDQTKQFEMLYGAHAKSDAITSDLVLWVFLLFLMVIVTILLLEADEYRIHEGINLDVHSKKK